MYGMINLALEQMVIDGFGVDTWERIKNKAGLNEVRFISGKAGLRDRVKPWPIEHRFCKTRKTIAQCLTY